jgi:hypothetical protein
MSRKKGVHYRAFLEPPSRAVDSYVHVDISSEGDWINLKIADCSRSVNLGFDPEKTTAMLNKIAKLRKALDLVENAVVTYNKLDLVAALAGGPENLLEES